MVIEFLKSVILGKARFKPWARSACLGDPSLCDEETLWSAGRRLATHCRAPDS